jgi:S-adenosylmethionine-dependent methyltransferase
VAASTHRRDFSGQGEPGVPARISPSSHGGFISNVDAYESRMDSESATSNLVFARGTSERGTRPATTRAPIHGAVDGLSRGSSPSASRLVVPNPFEIRSGLARTIESRSRRWRMTKMSTHPDAERFQREADKYATYLETPEGRLRIDLAFANLRESLPEVTQARHALDLGGGTGAIAVRLARLGFKVTLLDASQAMLDLANRAAHDAGVAESIALKQGDAGQLATLFPLGTFDLILCHNVLEFVADPGAVLRSVARALRGPSGMISVLVRNQPGEVLKAALLNGDLASAARNLSADWGDESLYGGTVRLFTRENLKAMLEESSFAVIAERGVRVVSDFLPLKVSRNDEYERIFDLERKLGSRLEFAAVARYVHCIAHRIGPVAGDGE